MTDEEIGTDDVCCSFCGIQAIEALTSDEFEEFWNMYDGRAKFYCSEECYDSDTEHEG